MNINKKIAKKVLAGSIAVMMTAGAVGAYNYNYNREIAHVQAAQEQEAKDLTKVAENVLSDAKTGEQAEGISKEESVYVKADATGKATKTTITEWLKNAETGAIEDSSELKDIKNIKGDEEFTQNNDGSLSWKSEGSDIYYQGTTDKELPVSVKVSYKLDGKAISAEDLKGKSGKVEIQFTYDNKSKQTVEVNGKKEEMYTPFTMVSAMMLSSDNYSNVSVENGKLISDGERQIVVGVAFPGLAENLNLKDSDLDIDIPETVTIKADAKDASVGPTITLASAELMNEFNLKDVDSFDDLDKSIGDLKDATNQLVDGSQAAADGAKQLADGAGTLSDGSKTLSNGVNTLNEKSGELISGVGKLSKGISDYTGGVEGLANGSSVLKGGVDQLAIGAKGLQGGIEDAKEGADQLVAGVSQAKENADQLAAAAAGVQQGITQVSNSLGEAAGNLSAINQDSILGSVDVSVTGGSATIDESSVDQLMAQFGDLNPDVQANIRAAIKEAVNESKVTISPDNVNKSLSPASAKVLGVATGVQNGIQTAQGMLTDTTQSPLAQGIAGVAKGTEQLSGALGMGDGKTPTIGLGAATLSGALGMGDGKTQTLGSGAKELVDGIGTEEDDTTILGGITALNAGATELQKNSAPLKAGLQDLSDGGTKLVSGVSELADGATKLADGATELADGATTLADGNQTLADGMLKYKEEAIDKLTDLFDGDISNVTDRIDAMSKLAENYKSFAGIKDGMAGSTKFIIETEGVDD